MSQVPPDSGRVALLGIPFDEYSSFLRGPAGAPPKIRQALHSDSSNLCTESGLDLGAGERWLDAGDLELPQGDAAIGVIEKGVGELIADGHRVVSLGGDHAVTYPIVRAHATAHGPLNILHLDAHPDLYDIFEGNRLSHACPFARIMEEGHAERLVQIGIRTSNPHQRTQATRFGVETIEMRGWRPEAAPKFDGPVYLSVDLDCLDPAVAPGVSHPEPGGFTTRDLVKIVQDLNVPVLGADIVELNPVRDPSGITAMVAAKILKEILGRMLEE